MGKKRKPQNRRQPRQGNPQGRANYDEANRLASSPDGTQPPLAPPPMDADEILAKARAVNRLKGALHAMSEPPEPLMAQFERLGIGVREINFEANFTLKDQPQVRAGRYFLIAVEDLFKGEEANQAQGSIIKRLYGAEAESEMMGNAKVPGAPGSKSNPLEPDQVLKANPLTHLSPSEQAQFRDLLARGVAAREAQARRNTIIDPNDLLGGQQ